MPRVVVPSEGAAVLGCDTTLPEGRGSEVKRAMTTTAWAIGGVGAYLLARSLAPSVAGYAETVMVLLWLALFAVYAVLRQRIEDLSMDLGMVELFLAERFPDQFSGERRFRSGD